MRFLVTGFKGQLGYDVVRELKARKYEDVLGIDIDDLDLTKECDVDAFVSNYKPDVIFHNAAYTAVDKAEDDYENCYKVNVLATRYLTNTAKKINAKILHISTDYVFGGNGNSFFEIDDKKDPKSVYGITKLKSEEEVIKYDKHFIVRISWVFGKNGHNFVKTMLNLADSKNKIGVVSDQIGSPTYTFDLSKLLVDMALTEKYGIYHATNEGVCSWYEFTKKIFEFACKKVEVYPLLTKEYKAKAERPLNSRLSKKSLDNANFTRLPNWEDALYRYLKEIEVIV